MATVPAMSLAATNLDIEEVYADIYDNATVASSLEEMNGLLTDGNADGAWEIPAWAIQEGTYAKGMYQGFERFEFVYGRSQSGTDSKDNLTLVTSLSTRFWLPWQASSLMVGWQGHIRNDTYFKIGTAQYQKWKMRFYVDGTRLNGLQNDIGISGFGGFATPSTFANGGQSDTWESRWPWMNGASMVHNAAKGYRTLRCDIYANLDAVAANFENEDAKLVIPTGGVWALAVR